MKKLFVIAVLMVYGFSTMGMSVHLHYCCGKLKEIAWSPVRSDECGMDHKMGSGKCCESKEISNKDLSDQDHSQLFAKALKSYAETARYFEYAVTGSPALRQLSPVAFAPPPLGNQPLHILHCVFRI
jgi:hypothetical protein